ncbi:MAG: family 43 glycosylhydrolase [Actinobacteria bacterium]|nr:family 43 glycosylhydrolase [Actinomycetota bacterium]
MLLPARPVIPGFHPDPSICRVGDTYYLAHSSFEYAPGVPVFRSADLIRWQHIGHALHRPSQLALDGAAPSGGVFAPTLRHHDGRFWMITTNATESIGQLLVTATDPAGPWSEPVRFPDAVGIDPDLCWDEDDTCYLTWAGWGQSGPMGIVQAVVDPSSGKVLTEPRRLWQGTGGKFPEGPHLYHIGEFWYLMIAEGGTERGHCVTIARATAPDGPFDPCPGNPLVTARGTSSPVQNTGHADLVRRVDGGWALVYLGTRPRGSSPEWHVLGRETFASEIIWDNGWPELADPIEPPAGATLTERLEPGKLPPSWVATARFPEQVLEPAEGTWRLTSPAGGDTFAGRRQEHLRFEARAELSAESGVGGLQLRIDPRHWMAVELADGRVRAVVHIGSVRCVLGASPAGPDVVAVIRAEEAGGAVFGTDLGPDEVVAGFAGPGGFTELGRLDGRYLSTEVAGGMTGRMIGVYCADGALVIRSFTYSGYDTRELTPTDGRN